MASTKPSRNRRSPLRDRRGFTLLEVMMVTAISAFVFAGVLSAYTFLGRSLAREVNEESLESRGRLALYWLTQDVSAASAICTQSPGATTSGYQITLAVPGLGSVYYYVDWSGGAGKGILKRQVGSTGATFLVLLQNLSSFTFGYTDINGNAVTAASTSSPTTPPTTQSTNIKQVYMYFTSTAGVAVTGNSSNFTVSSPMIIMKNKGFLVDPNNP
jgi:prepilin-type N-terminal cleavage/methylation domain-containing protein